MLFAGKLAETRAGVNRRSLLGYTLYDIGSDFKVADLFSWLFVGPHGLLALAFGYLLGSIPFGLVLTRMAGTQDIRTIGSGNIGATNVLRTGKKGLAAATLLGDALKGTLAVLIAGMWGPGLALIAGFGAFLGHLFPVWLGFKGAKVLRPFLARAQASSGIKTKPGIKTASGHLSG